MFLITNLINVWILSCFFFGWWISKRFKIKSVRSKFIFATRVVIWNISAEIPLGSIIEGNREIELIWLWIWGGTGMLLAWTSTTRFVTNTSWWNTFSCFSWCSFWNWWWNWCSNIRIWFGKTLNIIDTGRCSNLNNFITI